MDAALLQAQGSRQSEAGGLAHQQPAQEYKSEAEDRCSREHQEAAPSDRMTVSETRHEESTDVMADDANLSSCHWHCRYARVLFAFAALVLTAATLADVGVVGADLREYEPQPDNADNPRYLLRWFAISMLECIVMILFLLWELWHCVCGTRGQTAESETQPLQPLEEKAVVSRKRRAAWKLVLLTTFALWTVVLYMSTFINPRYGLHHLVLHVRFIYVTLLRIIVFSVFALTKLW